MIKSANGNELVGFIFSFDFKKTQFSRNEVKSAMIDNALDELELPKLSARTDFGRAIRHYANQKKDASSSLTYVSTDKNCMYFQMNREIIQDNAITDAGTSENIWIKEKDIEPFIKIVYDINENRIIVNDDYADAESVKSALYNLLHIKAEEYNKAEVTSAFTRNLIKFGNAVPIIRGQKVYFVPAKANGFLDIVETALKKIDHEVFISRWEAPREERVIQSVTQSVVEKMQTFNDSYQTQIESFIEQSKNISKENLANKMNEIASNVKFLESYRELLGEQTDKLLKNLDATKTLLEKYNLTGSLVNPYLELYKKIKEKNYPPEVEKQWFETVEIPDDVLDILESCN